MRPRALGCMYVQNCRRLELAVSYAIGRSGADHLDTTGIGVKRGEAIPRASSQAVAGESTNASSGGTALLWCQAVPLDCTIERNFKRKNGL